MCRPHYNVARKGGAFETKPYGVKAEVHFFRSVNSNGVCWEWSASLDRDGYGEFQEYLVGGRNKKWRAHRWCWEFLVGPIPSGMQLDHICRNKACVMPDHLEVVTNAENMRRRYALLPPKGDCRCGELAVAVGKCRRCYHHDYHAAKKSRGEGSTGSP
jgi:hypothetical protein